MVTDTQSFIIESPDRDSAQLAPGRLPERLTRASRALLAACEALVLFFLALLAYSGEPNGLGAAAFTAAAICSVSWWARLYARSFAVHARDEGYYACACVALAAIPVFLAVCGVGQIRFSLAVLALVLCALGSSVVRVRFHLLRRGTVVMNAGLRSITPRAWSERESLRYRISKRLFDVAVGSVVLVLLLPIMAVCALAILLESGRPVLFRQKRVGESGEPFVIYKFRTMVNGSGSAWVKPGDERITRIGSILRRTSFDELPQIFNVLRGEMSLVGPRPEMVDFAGAFEKVLPNYAQRHVVPPGITGWAQLYYKRNLTPDDVAQVLPYDVFYVEYTSVAMDLALIVKTVFEVLFHRAV